MTEVATGAAVIRGVGDVEDFARECFAPAPGNRVGVELEFLVFDRADLDAHVPVTRTRRALAEFLDGAGLPGGSAVTFEPGGQVELSAPPAALPEAIRGVAADVEAVRGALAGAGLILAGVGLDPVRPPLRQSRQPRYAAMAEFLDPDAGPLMMCSTASIQVNVDLGERPAQRWERAHALGPVLTAAFANSPLCRGRPCGWMSGRQEVWERLDRSRTAPVAGAGDPALAWARYLLDARLMLRRDGDGGCRAVRDGSTFRDRLASPGPPPTYADLAYHATTVFPPVRPRGWLEIRCLDAQRLAYWPVVVAVTHALVTDDRAGDAAVAAAEPYRDAWRDAARRGLAHPGLRRAADACFAAALGALPRLGAPGDLLARVAAFADRHVSTGRSPAADLLDAGRWTPDGA